MGFPSLSIGASGLSVATLGHFIEFAIVNRWAQFSLLISFTEGTKACPSKSP